MGILDKVKNMFIEEVEEEPIKKEIIQVKIPSPKVEQPDLKPKVEPVEEVTEKREEKFVFPVYFDDKDFEKIEEEKPKEIIKKEDPKPKKEVYGIKKEDKVEKKNFKPTPIISPVYGILDKNYHKDDIKTKKTVSAFEYRDNDKLNIDDVMKKAYGTLEDEIDNNLFEETSTMFNDELEEKIIDDEMIDIFDEPRHGQKEDINDNIEDKFSDIISEEEMEEHDNMIEEVLNKTYDEEKETSYVDELNDSDLFNLIDSMYEKKEVE